MSDQSTNTDEQFNGAEDPVATTYSAATKEGAQRLHR